MGYRSEVKIATTREGYDQMCERVDALSEGLGTSPLMGSCRKPDFFEESDGCVVFGWDYIKWYEGLLADVSNVADALSEIGESRKSRAQGFPTSSAASARAGTTSSSGRLATTTSSGCMSSRRSPSRSCDRIAGGARLALSRFPRCPPARLALSCLITRTFARNRSGLWQGPRYFSHFFSWKRRSPSPSENKCEN